MENGPFRMGNAAGSGRSTSGRPAANKSAMEAAAPVERGSEGVPREPVHRAGSSASHHPKPKKGKAKLIVSGVIVLVVLALVACGWLWFKGNTSEGIDGSKYQAVFFTNGQVYFGKLKPFNDKYMKLTDVYYLQNKTEEADSKNPQATAQEGSDVQLIKLGNEVHGPTDEMIISRDQVLFFENLKSDGKVSESISQFQNKQ